MNTIETRIGLTEESVGEITLEDLVEAVTDSIEPGEEALVAHVVNQILKRQGARV